MQLKGLLTGLFRWHYRQSKDQHTMQTLINLAVAFVIISWAIMGIGQMLLLWTKPCNNKEVLSKMRLMVLPIWARLLVVLISPVIIIRHNLLVSAIIIAVAAYCCL